mmetsp:Transcript_14669/g.22350  ORF Transcript_14669/g.22350 Transcript_14669/m.22350 type:complete len:190 (+) Transcript_14669:285-854(+)
MFIPSAASDTLQGRAIQKVNEKWCAIDSRWNGRESIGIPVCKKKYAPFLFHRPDGTITVERMYGCRNHSHFRKSVIERHGERRGWEPFGQWSLRKAMDMAKQQETMTSNSNLSQNEQLGVMKNLCSNGQCAWKVRDKCDDVLLEIQCALASSDSDPKSDKDTSDSSCFSVDQKFSQKKRKQSNSAINGD